MRPAPCFAAGFSSKPEGSAGVQFFSMTGWRYVNVTRDGGASCFVTATNSLQSTTGQYKLKLSSLMISAKGEVFKGAQGGMLSHAMTDSGSSKAVGWQEAKNTLKGCAVSLVRVVLLRVLCASNLVDCICPSWS